MRFDLGLKDKRALVTGGTKGVGAAVVEALRGAGARVVATARSVPAVSMNDIHYIAADVATAEGCAVVAAGLLDRLGGVDVIVRPTAMGGPYDIPRPPGL
ncbi:MAG: SDR family NAD(P)-dependent oxidoreductase [Pseudomonadota bacterium]